MTAKQFKFGKKVTLATLKSLIRNHRAELKIRVESTFNGQTDGVEATGRKEFAAAQDDEYAGKEESGIYKHTLGIAGVWLATSNYYQQFETPVLIGITVSNCCGRFTVAVPKSVA